MTHHVTTRTLRVAAAGPLVLWVALTLTLPLVAGACQDQQGSDGRAPELDAAPLPDGEALRFPDLDPPPSDAGAACRAQEHGWQGHCYLILGGGLGFSLAAARQACVQREAGLVTIETAAENAAVHSLLDGPAGQASGGHGSTWIGLRRSSSGSPSFSWEGGQSPTYVNWAAGEPNNSGGAEDCVELWRSGLQAGRWNDAPCSGVTSDNAVVCERIPGM
jgi:hypothetical protein